MKMKSPRLIRANRRRAIAFTLIELLVVVVIVAILASLVVPVSMKMRSQVQKKTLLHEEGRDADDSRIAVDPERRPLIEQIDLQLTLASEPQRVGLEVYNRYLLQGEGEIRFRNPSGRQQLVSLVIPFPEGTVEASNVRLLVADEGGNFREPATVEYRTGGISWTEEMAPDEVIEAQVRFHTLGAEAMEFELPPALRWESIDVSLDLGETSARGVAAHSLSPTGSIDGELRWQFENLVSSRKIVVVIPGAQSPSGRLLQLLRFMAVAVALFGGGFLYMNEREAPGRLDEFRLGHFSLLALIYSLFFIVFAVVIYRESMAVLPALGLAAGCSLPLLVIHVSRLASLGFALKQILPLAIVTLAIVVNGVYGGAVRDFVFLGIFVIVIAFLTLTVKPPGSRVEEVTATPVSGGAPA